MALFPGGSKPRPMGSPSSPGVSPSIRPAGDGNGANGNGVNGNGSYGNGAVATRPAPLGRPSEGAVRSIELPLNGDGAPRDPITPASGNGANGSSANGSSANGNGSHPAAPPAPEAEAEADFLADLMEMPLDADDNDFDDELLRLSHKVHSLLVDEPGG